MKVFLDVGHGGKDSGAVNGTLIEKNMNLITAVAARDFLIRYGIRVMLSRTDDSYLSLTERTRTANAWGADLFVSCHYNAGGGDRGETIYSIHGGAGVTLAAKIAGALKSIGQATVKEYSKPSTNYPGTDYYTVIASAKMPAVIVEPCFIDNALDRQLADTAEEQQIIGAAIAKGILNYLGISYDDKNNKGEDEGIMSKIFNELVEAHGEDSIKKAIESVVVAQKPADWKVSGSDYLHNNCDFSDTHDQSEPLTFGILGTVLSKLRLFK